MTTTIAKPKPLPKVVAPTSNILILGEICLVTIPMAPPAEVSPNYHGKLRGRMGATRAYRECARLATINVINQTILRSWDRPFPEGTRLALRVVIAWPRGHKRLDDDNAIASVKAARDGFAAALGCSDALMTLAAIEQVRDADGAGWTRIEAAAEG